jgi:hypothetical protein
MMHHAMGITGFPEKYIALQCIPGAVPAMYASHEFLAF